MTPAVPRLAATIVVCRPAPHTSAPHRFEVLLVKRHARSGFMANAHVFPGGRVDDADHAFAVVGAAARVDGLPATEAAAVLVCAVRETFEESGVLLARDSADRFATRTHTDAIKARLAAGASFLSALHTEGLVPDLERLLPLAWWLTPEAEPKRYDTRFFLVEAAPDHDVQVDGHETVEYRWLSPRDALAAYAHGDIVLAPPTLVTLEELDRDAPAGEIARAVVRPLRCICPLLTEDGGVMTLALPGDVLHAERVPVFPARSRIVKDAQGRFASALRGR